MVTPLAPTPRSEAARGFVATARLQRAFLFVALFFVPVFAFSAETVVTRVLFFTKSSGYEHSVIKRKNGQPSFAEKILLEIGPANGLEFTFSKDGSLFGPEYLAQFDAFLFFTSGDLTASGRDNNPPMTADGKQALLDAVKSGKGFVGVHSASDTFHTGESAMSAVIGNRANRYANHGEAADPYIRMLGGSFIRHEQQQAPPVLVVSPAFPGMARWTDRLELHEEWYSLIDFSRDLHVILALDTARMEGPSYQRPPYPVAWAHPYGQGRVFYTALGHREDVWENPLFQEHLIGGLKWATRTVDAAIPANIEKVTPGAWQIPPKPPAKQ